MADVPEIISPDTRRDKRVPPGQRETEGFPVLHYGRPPLTSVSEWTLRLFGLVDEERTLDWAEFSALPHVRLEADIHCVTTWSKLDTAWEGVGRVSSCLGRRYGNQRRFGRATSECAMFLDSAFVLFS